jgi:nitrile hydratase subunit beta
MNGIHDLGGMDGFGPVVPERDEPVFHEQWERDVFATTLATMGPVYNLDEFRHAIERMGNLHYLQGSYYEHWLASLETILTEKGVISRAELDARVAQLKEDPASVPGPQPRGDDQLAPAIAAAIRSGASTQRAVAHPARFAVGDRVVARVTTPRGHTRLPRYVRGKVGTVEIVHGAFVLPDTNAHLRGEEPEYVYAVRFDANEVWGDRSAGGRSSVYVDLWESYLEPQGGARGEAPQGDSP